MTVSHTVVARKSSMRTKSTEPANREVNNVAYADLVIFPHSSTCVRNLSERLGDVKITFAMNRSALFVMRVHIC